jgi:5-methylcytosine-specific restriction endonuclease McrA
MDEPTRERVRRRAANCCEYCRLPQAHSSFSRLHVEHIRPKKHGGSDAESNLCLACNFCNLHKSSNLTGIDPQNDAITRLFNPREDNWDDHFLVQSGRIIGRTAIGRTTIRVLNMNDEERVELRLELLG